jgi:hypothetical protein
VTITVRPIMRYSPLIMSCQKRPELSSPTSVTPFSLAALLALASSQEGLAAVSILNVLAMIISRRSYGFVTFMTIRKYCPSRLEAQVRRAKNIKGEQGLKSPFRGIYGASSGYRMLSREGDSGNDH